MDEKLETKTILTVAEAAEYLGLAQSTLNKWRCIGGGPKYLKMGKAVRYRMIDIQKWLKDNQRSHTSTI